MPLYDAHNHLQFAELAPYLDRVLADLAPLDLAGAVVNGTHPDDDWADVAALAARLPWVQPSYGIHPWDVGRLPADWQARFTARLTADPTAAVGEIGLDRLILEPARRADPAFAAVPAAPIEEQMDVFAWQLRQAAGLDRPASIHCVRAWGPLLEVLRDTPVPRRGILLHAYGGSAELVPTFVELGAYFSFNPTLADPRKTRQRAAFAAMPLDRLLVETDAPAFLPADPVHALPDAQLNHPANLVMAYRGLADLRDLPETELTARIAENHVRLFGST